MRDYAIEINNLNKHYGETMFYVASMSAFLPEKSSA